MLHTCQIKYCGTSMRQVPLCMDCYYRNNHTLLRYVLLYENNAHIPTLYYSIRKRPFVSLAYIETARVIGCILLTVRKVCFVLYVLSLDIEMSVSYTSPPLRALEERRRQRNVQEQRLRENILQQRKQRLQEATERFQRAHLPTSQRRRPGQSSVTFINPYYNSTFKNAN